MKRLLIGFILSLLAFSTAFGATSEDMKKLCEVIQSENAKQYITANETMPEGCWITLKTIENTSQHSNFRWNWRVHIINIVAMKNEFPAVIVIVNDCKESLGTGHSCVERIFVDTRIDGVADDYRIDFSAYTGEGQVLGLRYPEEFVDEKFNQLTPEELQQRYDAEVSYWINTINAQ
jgi:hypothetical protein